MLWDIQEGKWDAKAFQEAMFITMPTVVGRFTPKC
jgi:hypothetical protein